MIPLDSLKVFNEADLELLIGGMPTIDVHDWKLHTIYEGRRDQIINWFWMFLEDSNQETRAKLLQFVTASSAPPASGFAALDPKFKINFIERRVTKSRMTGIQHVNLPRSHTCFNILDLPLYESYQELKLSLERALNFGAGFGIE